MLRRNDVYAFWGGISNVLHLQNSLRASRESKRVSEDIPENREYLISICLRIFCQLLVTINNTLYTFLLVFPYFWKTF